MTGLEVFNLLKKGQWFDEIEKFGDINPRFKLFLGIIEKELKALEIIKEKEVNVFIFLHSGDLETYNDMVEDNRKLTKEEFEILKEIL